MDRSDVLWCNLFLVGMYLNLRIELELLFAPHFPVFKSTNYIHSRCFSVSFSPTRLSSQFDGV